MKSYCTITSGAGLRRLYDAGWGLFLTPESLKRNRPAFQWSQDQDPPMPYAVDNGAWTAFVRGTLWESPPFLKMLEDHGARSDFAVLPDIVEGGAESLARSVSWLDRVLSLSPVALIPVQDGMDPQGVIHLLSPKVGVFVGGSTEYKERTLAKWAKIARSRGAWCHVGRVNTGRRVKLCTTAGAHSIDGTAAARFGVRLGPLDAARRQLSFMDKLDKTEGQICEY